MKLIKLECFAIHAKLIGLGETDQIHREVMARIFDEDTDHQAEMIDIASRHGIHLEKVVGVAAG